MKLYATTTSERASKGQGGNDRLDIEVLYGSATNQIKACSVYMQANKDGTFLLTITDNENSTLLHKQLKGKSQKGDQYKEHDPYCAIRTGGKHNCIL
jgi:hypothetical protein